MVRIMTVMDNAVSGNRGLKACHGLSFYIQSEQIKLLFDFGQGPETWENARRLNVPLSQLSYLVFSHSHYDHCTGFLWAKEHGVKGIVVHGAEKAFFQEKYKKENKKLIYLGAGFDQRYFHADCWQQLVCEDTLELGKGCWAAGRFKRIHPQESISERYVREEEEKMETDSFEDEICLVFKTTDGLAVTAGCSHPGIINILDTVTQRFGEPVRTVIGGLHLSKAEPERMEWTAKQLRRLGVKKTALNHCTGKEFMEVLAGWGIENCCLDAGSCLYL